MSFSFVALTAYTPLYLHPCHPPLHSPTSSLPPCLPPFSRGRYRRTCTSLLRYKVSFHLLTQGTGFPCMQHRGKRTRWGWIVPHYLRGGCSLSVRHGEGQQAVGGFFSSRPYLVVATLVKFRKRRKSSPYSPPLRCLFNSASYSSHLDIPALLTRIRC